MQNLKCYILTAQLIDTCIQSRLHCLYRALWYRKTVVEAK